jgi:hypothetical protein
MEYIVKLDQNNIDEKSKTSTVNKNSSGASISDKVTGSTKLGLKSKTISVVQGMDNPLQAGQRVYVIYNDNRPRVIPAR